jgi:L-2-hydroxyglutarate oxidase LhgO
VEGVELVGPERIREIEPHCVGVEALWSPVTGIVDFSRVAEAVAADVREAGGDILLDHQVHRLSVSSSDRGAVMHTSAGELRARHVIVCAGLYADRLARQAGADRDPRIVPFRGDYWLIRPERRYLAKHLIYPVPDPSFPFLGVHFTRRIGDGSVWLGPNAVLAFAREGYRRLGFDPYDLAEVLAFPGFQKLALRYWRTGLAEMVRDFSRDAFVRSLQQYVPELTADDLLPGPSGVRAQALGSDGQLVDDFVVHVQEGRVLHVRNAPSPAATSSLAIARLIADTAESSFQLAA